MRGSFKSPAVSRSSRGLPGGLFGFLSLLLVVAFTTVAMAAALPALTGRVVDAAGILDSQTEAAMTQKLADFEQKSSDQIVVVTVPSLDGEDIEGYSNRLYRTWALDQKQENNGVLLVVAPNDRKVRIEVGYGLEGTMTDLMSRIIIENQIIPAFRSGDFAAGVSNGVDGILMVLSGDSAELEARARRNVQTPESDVDWIAVAFITVWVLIFFGGFGFALMARIFGRKLGPGRYEWLGIQLNTNSSGQRSDRGRGGWSGGGGGGWSSGSGGGGFSGGGGSSGGGGASGSW